MTSYPRDAFPTRARNLIDTMTETVQAPVALTAAPVLAAMGLLVQSLANVRLPNVGARPTSLFCLSIAHSGERKSAVDGIALDAITQHQKRCAATGIPADPNVIQDLTIPGIDQVLENGVSSISVFNDDASAITHGRSVQDESKMDFLSAMSRLWDGAAKKVVRKTDGEKFIYGRRLSSHLMLQPVFASGILADPFWFEQGTLARFLVTWPDTTMGTRLFRRWNQKNQRCFDEYQSMMRSLLEVNFPHAEGEQAALDPPTLGLTRPAEEEWIKFHNDVEKRIRPGCSYASVYPAANKAAEQAGRIAAVMSVIKNGNRSVIGKNEIERGIIVSQYYLDQMVNLKATAEERKKAAPENRLIDWIKSRCAPTVSKSEMLQRGPYGLRRKQDLNPVLGNLVEDGYLERVSNTTNPDSGHRSEIYQIKTDKE